MFELLDVRVARIPTAVTVCVSYFISDCCSTVSTEVSASFSDLKPSTTPLFMSPTFRVAVSPLEYWLSPIRVASVSYTHLRAHETVLDLVCRLLLEKKKK